MSLPPPLLSTLGKMVVVFISDRSVSGAGFSAIFKAADIATDCDRTFTAPSGTITFDPSIFSQITKCDYHILVNISHQFLLVIIMKIILVVGESSNLDDHTKFLRTM